MTEEKLREDIAELINSDSAGYLYLMEHNRLRIATIIVQALPRLAKEAGYVLPNSKGIIWDGVLDTLNPEDMLRQWAKDNGYVKLADNQVLLTFIGGEQSVIIKCSKQAGGK